MKKEEVKKRRSAFDFIIYFIIKVNNDDIFALGAQLAYYLVLSFFPFLIFVMTLIGYINLDPMKIIEGLARVLPSNVVELTSSVIIDVVEKQHGGLLGACATLTIWSASSAFRAILKGVNKAYNIKENRSFIKSCIIPIICTIALAFTIMLTLATLVFGDVLSKYILKYIPYNDFIHKLWDLLRYSIVIVVMIIIFAAIYRYTPSKRTDWSEAIPGAVFVTLGWIVVSLAFSFYVNNFANYSRIYGSLATIFVLMTWLYISSIIIIIGGEINSVLGIRKDQLDKKFL